MGWKAIKEHYKIAHIVQVTNKGICIGSPYIHNIMIVSLDGELVKPGDGLSNEELRRYRDEMLADPQRLRELATAADTFSASVPVYTYDGANIIEKQCEDLGWPNVTHDGEMMYENTFSTDRAQVIEWAKKDCLSAIASWTQRVAEQKSQLAEYEGHLADALANAAALGVEPVAESPNPSSF